MTAFSAAVLGVSQSAAFAVEGPADCPDVGDVCSDGTVFAGVVPGSDAFLFTTPADAPGVMMWDEARQYARDMDAHGRSDWTLPGIAELDMLQNNKDEGALKGTFNESGSIPSGWYWSATEYPDVPDGAWMERFSDGGRGWYWKDGGASVRPVRSEPRP